MMNFRQLRTFVAIAESGGFARAVGRLHVSQPAASRQIQVLEAELGLPLFDRIGRRIQLTSEGEDLLRRSRRLLQDIDAISERARELKGGHGGMLRVGATPQVIEVTLSQFLVRYKRRHPGVEVHLIEEGGASLPGRIEDGEVNLAVIPADDRFASRMLFPAYGLALVSTRHPLSKLRTLDIAELEDEPLLLLRRGFGSRAWFDAACEFAHINPRVLMESAAPQAIMALAATGYGVAIIPSTVRIPRSGVRAVPLVQRGMSIGRWLTLAWNPQRFLAPYAERFVDELVAHCRQNYPGREFIKRAPPLPQPKVRDN